MTFYAVNHLLRWTENGSLDRVLWIDLAGTGAFVIDINAATALPRFCEADSLEQARSEGLLVLEKNDPTVRYTQEGGLSKEQTEKRHAAWKIVQPLVKSQPAIFLAKKRGPLIREGIDAQLARWTIQLHPEAYIADRISSASQLQRLVQESAISLRSWSFPIVGRLTGAVWSNFDGGSQSYYPAAGRNPEAIRVYKSGLAVWRSGVKEDYSQAFAGQNSSRSSA